VEKAAVDDAVERASETAEIQRIQNQELRRSTPLLRLGFGLADSPRRGAAASRLAQLTCGIAAIAGRWNFVSLFLIFRDHLVNFHVHIEYLEAHELSAH